MSGTGLRVAVALGSGGARGYAHIGALEVLAERGHEVVAIAGTSMGALVGGVAAAGKLAAYTQWSRSLTQREVWRLLDMNLLGAGAIRGERVFGKVGEILEGARIEDCAIPFTAVATDLNNRREVWFQRGPLESAIRASTAIPGLITPVVVGGRLLVDGGLMNPVPIEPTTSTLSDLTLAVSLNGPRQAGPIEIAPPPAPAGPTRSLGDSLSEGFRSLTNRFSVVRDATAAEEGAEAGAEVGHKAGGAVGSTPEHPVGDGSGGSAAARSAPAHPQWPEGHAPAPRDLSSADVFNRSFDVMAALITRYRMASNPPDVLVTVPSDACKTMDFHRAAEMIDLGRTLTEQALDAAGL